MKKVYSLFRKFTPIIVGLSAVSALFGLLSLIYYYNAGTVSINFKNVIPICTVAFFVASIATVIYFVTKIDKLHISKIKKSFGFCHFAAALSAALAAALFFFDFFRFVQAPTTSSALRILRLVAFVPFIVYLVLGMIPRKIHRQRIYIPVSIKYVASIGAVAWAVLGLLMIYFWDGLPITNIFKITHLFFYVFLLLFLAFEIKFELISPSSKLYVLFSFLLFVYATGVTGSVMLAKFFGFAEEITISEFEIFLAFALGIYALSKMIAVPKTMQFVMERGHTHHHRRHRHHKKTEEKVEENVVEAEASELADEVAEPRAEEVAELTDESGRE